jgi:hypothetical protein
MFKSSKTKKKANYTEILKEFGLGIAGGFVGNQITTLLEKQSFMTGYSQYTPVVTVLAAGAGRIFVPSLKEVFNGAAIVAGTEFVESMINKATSTSANGVQFGYVPKPLPAGTPAPIRNKKTDVGLK